jgi:hypothetical protein
MGFKSGEMEQSLIMLLLDQEGRLSPKPARQPAAATPPG